MPIVEKRDDQSVDHFGRSTIRRQHAAPKEADRGENSEPGETRPKRLCLTPAIRELQWGRITALTKRLEALIAPPGFTGKAPGGPSRWSTERSGEWEPLKPQLVVEVRYDHVTDNRFRHGTKLMRFRPDKSPKQCTFEQLAPPMLPRSIKLLLK